MKNKNGAVDVLHLIVGILLVGGGVSFLINKSQFGAVLASLGLLIEVVKSWLI